MQALSVSHPPPLSVCLPSLISSAFFFMREGSAIAAPSVRSLAGEMDVSVSQSCLISVRCSVYFRLFRGVLAGKVHRCSFYFNSQICLGKVELRSFCLTVFQQYFRMLAYVSICNSALKRVNKGEGLRCSVACGVWSKAVFVPFWSLLPRCCHPSLTETGTVSSVHLSICLSTVSCQWITSGPGTSSNYANGWQHPAIELFVADRNADALVVWNSITLQSRMNSWQLTSSARGCTSAAVHCQVTEEVQGSDTKHSTIWRQVEFLSQIYPILSCWDSCSDSILELLLMMSIIRSRSHVPQSASLVSFLEKTNFKIHGNWSILCSSGQNSLSSSWVSYGLRLWVPAASSGHCGQEQPEYHRLVSWSRGHCWWQMHLFLEERESRTRLLFDTSLQQTIT